MLDDHISKKEAMRRIREVWNPAPESETVDIDYAEGRIAAEDIKALYDLPVVRSSGMDGICVNYDLFEGGIPDASGWKRGVEYERADTGDDFDDRYDTVIPIEWITPVDEKAVKGDRIELSGGLIITKPEGKDGGNPRMAQELKRGMNVRPSGSMMKAGTMLLEKKMKITAMDLASLVTGGYGEVKVIRKPVISFIPTGSELIPAGAPLNRGQNFDANSHMAAAMLRELGAQPKTYGIVKDKRRDLADVLEDALSCSDVVIINGGSSKGDEDYNTELLNTRGRLLYHWIKAAPGRPMAAAITEEGKLILNVAGPTLAAYYGIAWCVCELLSDWYGTEIRWGNEITVTAAEDMPSPPLSVLKKMQVREDEDGRLTARQVGGSGAHGGRGQHNMPGVPVYAANAIYFTDPDSDPVKAGDPITVIMVR